MEKTEELTYQSGEDNGNQSLEMILVQMGLLTEEGLILAADEKRRHPEKRLEDILLELEIITEFSWIRAMGVKYKVPLVNLAAQKISSKVLRYVSEADARKYTIIPVHETEYVLHIASNNPLNYTVFDMVSQACGKQVMPLLATKVDIEESISQSYIVQNVNNVMQQIALEFGKAEDEDEDEIEVLDLTQGDSKSNAVVQAVKLIIEQAYQRGASDIHLEPMEAEVLVRIRVDGELVETMSFAKPAFNHIASRLKVLGGLDIAEKRVPQDGRLGIVIQGKRINMRISTLPVLYGEKVVIRILGSSAPEDILLLEDLNLEPYNYELLIQALKKPNGILLITGPTGSGKSTTVYSALMRVNQPTVNIITVEDPVERILPGVNQVQVNAKTGLTFAAGLRSILRQDPDIIMIGEIRDNETASIGAKAAITGHLVIATMHTNDAASSFMRLMDMGVEPYLVASAVISVVAQRLVRKICKYCREPYEPEEEELLSWDGELPEHFYHGRGCPMCNNSGYRGRMGIYEIINVDTQLQKLIVDKADTSIINEYAQSQCGMKTLTDNARNLVVRGITTIEEMNKIKNS